MIFHVASLGCARNLVDSESMTGRLLAAGYETTEDPAEAEVIVINTCSFIEAAINESIDTILALAGHKTDGACRRMIGLARGLNKKTFDNGFALETI